MCGTQKLPFEEVDHSPGVGLGKGIQLSGSLDILDSLPCPSVKIFSSNQNIEIFTSKRMITISHSHSVKTRQTKRVSNSSKDPKKNQEFKMDRRLNPNVPTFTPNQNNPLVTLQSAMARADEDILNLKLLNFELQIEVNRKEEENRRLHEVINKLLTKFQDQPKYI